MKFIFNMKFICFALFILGCWAVDDPSAKPILSRKVRQMMRIKPGYADRLAGAAGGNTFLNIIVKQTIFK